LSSDLAINKYSVRHYQKYDLSGVLSLWGNTSSIGRKFYLHYGLESLKNSMNKQEVEYYGLSIALRFGTAFVQGLLKR